MKALVRILSAATLFILAAGCATPVSLRSAEVAVGPSQEQVAGRTVAILPLAARVGRQRNLSVFSAAQEVYLQRVGAGSGIKAGREIEQKFSQQSALPAAYQEIISKLVDRDPNLDFAKGDAQAKLCAKPWDGQSGIKYSELADINAVVAGILAGSNSMARNGASAPFRDIRLQWRSGMKKDADYPNLPVSAVRSISRAMGCDYLLIPVVRDLLISMKGWYVMGILPLFRTADVYPTCQLALYLVDGESGQIVHALQVYQVNPRSGAANDALFMVLSLHKVLQKGNAFGSFDFK